jgi:ferritin
MVDNKIDIRLNAIDNTKRAFDDLNKNLKETNNTTQKVSTSFLTLKNAVLAFATGATLRAIINTTASFENLRTTLKFVTGSIESGNNAFQLLQNLSLRSKFSVEQLSDAFVALYSSGINPTEELLTTFINTASVFGNEIDTLNDLTRLFAKGTQGGLGLQSLNQLAGKGIPVFDILEQKLGVTKDTLAKFAEGTGNSEKILKALQEGLSETFAGANEARVNNLSTAISSLGREFLKAFETLSGGGGFNRALIDLINSLKELLSTLNPLIKALGKVFSFIADSLTGAFQFLNDTIKDTISLYNKLVDFLGLDKTVKIEITRGQLEQGAITPPTSRKADTSFFGLLNKELREAQLTFKTIEETLSKGVVEGIKGVSRGIAEAIVLGKSLNQSFRELAQKILVQVIERLIEEQLIKLSLFALDRLRKALEEDKTREIQKQNNLLLTQLGYQSTLASLNTSGSSGGGNGFGLGDLISIGSSIFGGFAEGGAVKGGQPITVGERGRELFVPNTNGTIVPNQDLGVGANNYNFTIVATDVRGVKDLLLNNRSTIVNIMNQALNAKGKSSLV